MQSRRMGVGRVAGLAVVLALWIFLAPSPSAAALIVDATVADAGGGVFDWEFAVTNTGPADVSIVSVTDAPLFDLLIDPSLTAPVGFVAFYDPGVGIVDFIEGAQPFTVGSSVGGFAFSSLAGPGSGAFQTFEALDIFGGLTQGVVNQRVVPEPALITLLTGGLLTLTRRRRGRG